MAIARGRDGTVYIAAGLTAFASEACTSAGAGVYQITAAAKRNWDPGVPIVVTTTAGTIDLTYMDNGVDWATGKVKLTVTGATVTVSGQYWSGVAAVADIHQWTIGLNRIEEDTTPLGAGWYDCTAVAMKATVSLGRWRTDTYFDQVASAQFFLLKLDENASTGFWVVAHRAQLTWTKTVGRADQEALSFESHSPVSRY